MEEYFDVSEMAYALYKQDWLDESTTAEERLENIREYYSYVRESLADNEEPDTYEDWLFEVGFNGSLYVCYEEFCDEEYHDKDYVSHLFGGDEEMMKLYYQDIENEEE